MILKLKLWINFILALVISWFPSTKKEEKRLSLDLQFFGDDDSEKGDDQDDDDSDDNQEDEDQEQTLEQILKDNPSLKKQFNALFKDKFSKRLKGLDLDKARKALEAAEKQENDDTDKDEKGPSAKEMKLERKTKRLAVKEYAVDNGYNPKLVARLIDLDAIELDEDGEVDPDDLEEVIEDLTSEFPELFSSKGDEDEDEDEDEKKDKKKSYQPGSKQTGNKKKQKDRRAAGAERAKQRHKKEE
ncbi:phage scaffolding protein [Niallia sp. 03190]|uniref:phage scaffolding protein n=1 Tax=Niallia sp. 03190 TaxID=3458061 RepID=UPI00404408E9